MNLHTEDLHKLYSLPNFIRTMKGRRMRPAGHAARKEATRNVYSILVGKTYKKGSLGRSTTDGRIILKSIFKI